MYVYIVQDGNIVVAVFASMEKARQLAYKHAYTWSASKLEDMQKTTNIIS